MTGFVLCDEYYENPSIINQEILISQGFNNIFSHSKHPLHATKLVTAEHSKVFSTDTSANNFPKRRVFL